MPCPQGVLRKRQSGHLNQRGLEGHSLGKPQRCRLVPHESWSLNQFVGIVVKRELDRELLTRKLGGKLGENDDGSRGREASWLKDGVLKTDAQRVDLITCVD